MSSKGGSKQRLLAKRESSVTNQRSRAARAQSLSLKKETSVAGAPKIDVSGLATWRVNVYLALNRSEHYKIGHRISIFLLCLILFSVVMFVLSTEEDYYDAAPWLFDGAEDVVTLTFTLEFVLRMISVGVNPRFRTTFGCLRWLLTINGFIDFMAIAPWWVEKLVGQDLPSTLMLRMLRIFRVLNHEKFLQAVRTLARVIHYNREVLGVAGVLGIILLLATSTLLFAVNRENDPDQFGSIPLTMYLCILMLTGQGEPDGELDTSTKLICVLTAVASVAVFAIPASMLAWGFEAEAERLINLRQARKSKRVKHYKERPLNFNCCAQEEVPPREAISESETSSGWWESDKDFYESDSSTSSTDELINKTAHKVALEMVGKSTTAIGISVRDQLTESDDPLSEAAFEIERLTRELADAREVIRLHKIDHAGHENDHADYGATKASGSSKSGSLTQAGGRRARPK